MNSLSSNLRRNWPLWAALGVFWAIIIRQFSPHWTIYPQYNYGWGVPFLCLFLFSERWPDRPQPERARHRGFVWLVVLGALLLFLPARLVQEANTTWRVTIWVIGGATVAVTTGAVYLAGGVRWLKHFGFAIAFFLVAVPWPGGLENLVIQKLTGWNAATTVELLVFQGIPAVQQGNAIEVSAGPVGIDEACSGIRSLQATLMIALFFGEFYRYRLRGRLGLIGAAVGMSFVFNVARTYLLVTVAARQGLAAMAKWHDPAGVSILLGCFTAVWVIAHYCARKTKPAARTTVDAANRIPTTFLALVAGMAVIAEAGTELWYRAHERGIKPAAWSVTWPERESGFAKDTISKDVREIMNFDDGQAVRWVDPDGYGWRGFYFAWHPASSLEQRVKIQAAKGHRPDICLRAVGFEMKEQFEPLTIPVREDLTFQFHRYRFESQGVSLYVFYAAWEDGVADSFSNLREDSHAKLAAARSGTRGLGQRMLEFIISGAADEQQARTLFESRLKQLVH